MAEIYPSAYGSYVKPGQRLFMAIRRAAWAPELREIVRLTGPESRILEIGSATGEFLAALRRAGRPNLIGVEFSPHAAAVARERHGLDVRPGDLLDADLVEQSVDLVVMRHVLEHVPDPLATLARIARLLRPGGHCIVTIPNIDSDTAAIFGADWYGYDLPRHFHLFPLPALAQLLREAGLQRVRIHHIGLPNVWIGSLRFWLASRGMAGLAQFFQYTNPLALALFLPLGLASSLLRSSGVIRLILRRPLASSGGQHA
jgi:SAM-dependent methyltransferase